MLLADEFFADGGLGCSSFQKVSSFGWSYCIWSLTKERSWVIRDDRELLSEGFSRFFLAGLLDCYGALLGCFWLELCVLTGYQVKSWEIFEFFHHHHQNRIGHHQGGQRHGFGHWQGHIFRFFKLFLAFNIMDQGLGQDRDRELLNLIVRKTTLFTNTHAFPLSIHSRLLFRGRVTPHIKCKKLFRTRETSSESSNLIGNSSLNPLLSLDLRVNLKSTFPFYKHVKEGKRDRGDGGILDQGRRVSQR